MDFRINYNIQNKITSAPLEGVMLRGEIGERFDVFSYKRIWSDFAKKEIWREAEECFAEKYDDEFPWGLWRSEFWGKLMISAVRVCRMKNDPELKEFLRESAYRVLAYQNENGYVGTYKNEKNVFKADPEDVRREKGGNDFNWNVWGTKYTLWALIECALLTDDAHILECAEKLAENVLDAIDEYGVRVKDCGVQEGMAASSIMKPMLILYRLTGDKRYYDCATDIAAEFDRADGEKPNLIANALSGKPVNRWYKGTNGNDEYWSAKAYEMMSCFDGFIELYRIGGDVHVLEAAEAMYDILVKYETNVLGSVGYCERFADAALYPDASTEICDVIHWMRLCYELFCVTGEAKYMESFEKAFLNAFLAGVYEDGKNGAFFIRSSGRHWRGDPQVETKYQHCCVNNIPRGFCNAAEAVIMKGDDAYYVNTYIPFRAVFGDTDFKLGAGYLDNGKVILTVRNADKGTKIKFRIPEWSNKTVIWCGETVVCGKAGEYAELSLAGDDAIIHLEFDMTPRILDFEGEFKVLSETDYHVRRFVDYIGGFCDRSVMVTKPMSTLRRGALIYSRSKRVGCTEEEMFSGKTVFSGNYNCRAEVLRHTHMLSCIKATFEKDGEYFSYIMCDYASATNRDTEDVKYFNMFV